MTIKRRGKEQYVTIGIVFFCWLDRKEDPVAFNDVGEIDLFYCQTNYLRWFS
jgi:hypothetical protein